MGVIVKAYTYLLSVGKENFGNVGRYSVLNANYIKESLKDLYLLPIKGICKHEFVFDGLKDKSTHVTTLDVAKRLLDYDCKVKYKRTHMIVARKIRKPDDIRPGTKKGKLDRVPVWMVEIMMPKSLVMDIYSGYKDSVNFESEPAVDASAQGQNEMQPSDQVADPGAQPEAEVAV